MHKVSAAIFLTLVLASWGCQEKARIGVVLPLSGEHRIYGESSRKGLELALEELRANGETRIELEVVDSGSDPERAREQLSQLFREGVLVAIGGLRPGEARAMADVAEDFERVLLSPSASVRHPSPGARYFFSLSVSDDVAGTTMASFAALQLGIKSSVLIREPGVGAEGLEKGFRSTLTTQGGELLASLQASGDPVSTIDQALDYQPDAVYLAGDEATVERLVRELRIRRFAGRILTTQALACSESLRRLGDDTQDVLLTHTVFQPDQLTRFAGRYREKYGEEPDVFAAESYDALRVLAASLRGRSLLPSEVRKGLLHDIEDFQGVTGTIRFDEARGVAKIPRVYSVTEELTLRDHGRWLQAERERMEEELLARLREIAETMAGEAPWPRLPALSTSVNL